MTNSTSCVDSSRSDGVKLLVFGNPLLDVTVKVQDDELLRKYSLEKNGQKEVTIEKLHKLISDAKLRYKTFKFSLGGSGLNSARILAELGTKDLLFFGGIGDDQNGKIVKEILKRSNVKSCLQQFKDIRTGTCLCLCEGENRSLTANIGAALKVEHEYIESKLKNIMNPMFYYIEGFFIPEKMHICRSLYEKYSKNPEIVLITNLNAPYIVKTFPKDITWLARKADIVFGNRDEFEELATINGFQTMEDQLTDLLNSYSRTDRRKILVVTDGASPVLYLEGNKSAIESNFVNVPEVNASDIIDTTGAGDSFVAGFVHGIMTGKMSTQECIMLGCEISAKVITVIGCNLPKI